MGFMGPCRVRGLIVLLIAGLCGGGGGGQAQALQALISGSPPLDKLRSVPIRPPALTACPRGQSSLQLAGRSQRRSNSRRGSGRLLREGQKLPNDAVRTSDAVKSLAILRALLHIAVTLGTAEPSHIFRVREREVEGAEAIDTTSAGDRRCRVHRF